MIEYLIAVLLSMAPFSELRGGIAYGLAAGGDIFWIVILCIFFNILAIFIVFFFLDYVNEYFVRFGWYKRLFDKFLLRARRKVEDKIGSKWEYWALFFLVAIPLPTTGAYTGCLASWAFKLDRQKSIKAITLGVICAGIITTLVTLGVLNFF
tara:strand:- start:205 stop:660 length:456 start_codon:yes stop_codon:yes gene_type:complete